MFYRVLLYKVEVENVKIVTFYLLVTPPNRLYFTNCEWRKLNNFVLAA